MTSIGNVALVHDWLVGQRGGEQVLLQLLRAFPGADVLCLVHQKGSCHPRIEQAHIRTSFVQHLPFAPKKFRLYLPLFWAAIEQLDVRAYDVVISSSHCVALGVQTHPHQTHLAYIHSPMRYLYDQLPEYLPRRGRALSAPIARVLTRPWRRLDQRMASRPDALLANSAFVRDRIRRVWDRPSVVVPPPVDTHFFGQRHTSQQRAGLICVTALTPYKRVDAVVRFATAYQEPLLVVGRGPLQAQLRRQAGPSVQFVDGLSREALREQYQRHEAFVFAGEEDAGIAPIEAMAAGCPLVAFHRGGVPEAMAVGGPNDHGVGGTVFRSHTPRAIADALHRLRMRRQAGLHSPAPLAHHASHYSEIAFRERIHREVRRVHLRLGAGAHPG